MKYYYKDEDRDRFVAKREVESGEVFCAEHFFIGKINFEEIEPTTSREAQVDDNREKEVT